MARSASPIIKRFAIFVKDRKDGRDVYVRRPYDVVEYNWGDVSANATYFQPHFGHPQSRETRSEVYDDLRIYDKPPTWDLIGGGSDL